jgi:hypothetical protein
MVEIGNLEIEGIERGNQNEMSVMRGGRELSSSACEMHKQEISGKM